MAKGKKKKSRKIKTTEPDLNLYYGKGSFILPNDDFYEGDYCAHRAGLIWREGHGVYKTHDGQTYEGEWKDDKLIENKELIITYPNGAEYYGRLSKNKYKGPGTYALECKMDLSCNFEGNKPIGIVALVDYEGKLWVGEARQNKAILLPENIFYLNLLEENGKGYLFEEQTASIKSIEAENDGQESLELTDRDWENVIFKKSSKTENDVDFNDSKWAKKFERFRICKEEILRKLDESISLTYEEQFWIEKFRRYLARRKKREAENVLLKIKASEETMMLLEKFRSPQFNDSCPGVSVIYASPYFNKEIAGEESEKKISCEESYDEDIFLDVDTQEDDTDTQDASNVTIFSYYGLESSGHFKSDRFDNLIKLKDYVKQLQLPKSKLHFTEKRENQRAEIGAKIAQKREEAKQAATLLTKMSERSKVPSEEKREEKRKEKRKGKRKEKRKEKKKDVVKKSKDASEVSSAKKKASTTTKTIIDEKVALQERIKKHVEEYFEAKEKIRQKEQLEIVLPRIEAHTHNIAVCSESVDRIQINLEL